ncbi:MAG: hypothetical protein HYY85_20030 [Deltaproteobacteria bacterium]|nr:hypothetical protein [Deltaproteobacteria bacterium]
MEWVIGVVAMAGLVVAVLALRAARSLRGEQRRVTSLQYEHLGRLTALEEQVKQEVLRLSLEIRRKAGESVVSPEMPVSEILALHPQAGQVLAGFHIGGCGHCAVTGRESLAEVAEASGTPLPELLTALNDLLEGKAPAPPAPGGMAGGGFVPLSALRR